MLDHISSLSQLEAEAITIDEFLQITMSENPDEAVLRGNDLVVYMARTGKMLADAKYHKDIAVSTSIIKELGERANIAPSILKQLVDASSKNENLMVNWIERLNRTCFHQVEWLRTVVSKAKQEQYLMSGVNSMARNNSSPF